MQSFFSILLVIALISASNCRWSEERAWKWYNSTTWSAGVNYYPNYAVNPIQMWQSFDINAINKEITWATELGFSKFRTFLHIQPYLDNKTEFLNNVWKYLAILKNKKAQAILVLFDDCWRPTYQGGKQPEPIKGLCLSQWVQCPGDMPFSNETLKDYVTTVMRTFANSQTVAFWDMYNEVGGYDHGIKSLPLLINSFQWARQVNPSQPLTSCFWNNYDQFQVIGQIVSTLSDIVTFHCYCDVNCTLGWINRMRKYNRPVICTEYMARTRQSLFITHMPLLKEQNVWAINWGFVFGRAQSYYPWQSKEGAQVPAVWFHDVLHPNGTSFDPRQTDFIKNITSSKVVNHLNQQ